MGQEGFPGGSEVKNLPAKGANSGLIPGFGKSPGDDCCNLDGCQLAPWAGVLTSHELSLVLLCSNPALVLVPKLP